MVTVIFFAAGKVGVLHAVGGGSGRGRSGTAKGPSVTDYWPATLYVWQVTCTGIQLGCDAAVAPWPTLAVTLTAVAGTKYYMVTDASYSGPSW